MDLVDLVAAMIKARHRGHPLVIALGVRCVRCVGAGIIELPFPSATEGWRGALDARAYAEARSRCPDCEGSGWVLPEPGEPARPEYATARTLSWDDHQVGRLPNLVVEGVWGMGEPLEPLGPSSLWPTVSAHVWGLAVNEETLRTTRTEEPTDWAAWTRASFASPPLRLPVVGRSFALQPIPATGSAGLLTGRTKEWRLELECRDATVYDLLMRWRVARGGAASCP